MPNCRSCSMRLSNKTSGLICNGPCGQHYHANSRCCEITKTQLPRIRGVPSVGWICVTCRNEASIGPRQDGVGTPNVAPVDHGEVPANAFYLLRADINQLRTSVEAQAHDDIRVNSLGTCSGMSYPEAPSRAEQGIEDDRGRPL
ncbi:hypothetical protein HHI36_017852, partial [Cryptolaemus montrouzieri]